MVSRVFFRSFCFLLFIAKFFSTNLTIGSGASGVPIATPVTLFALDELHSASTNSWCLGALTATPFYVTA